MVPNRHGNSSSYRYGFNTQEKVDEISGEGNHNTALFWEYDTRLGRRWNLDPIDQINISNYAVNQNNPILTNDPNGDDPDKPKKGTKNIVVISQYSKPVGHDDNKDKIDDAQALANKGAEKLDDDVITIYAKNRKDLMSQLKDKLGDNKINNIIFSAHGSYKNPGIFIGDDFVSSSNAKEFGSELKPFMDTKESSMLLISCHSGAGENNKGNVFTKFLANSSGADVYATKTWGIAGSKMFDNNNIWSITPDYANFAERPKSVDDATAKRKPNALKYLGEWTLTAPNAQKIETVTKLFVRHNGNFTFSK